MNEFDLLRNITVGQYIPTDSFVHRVDPRAKLLVVLFFALAVAATRSLLYSLLILVLLLGIAWAARIPIPYVLRGILPALPFLAFLFLMQFFFQGRVVPCDVVYYEWRFVRITPCLLNVMVLGAVRVVAYLFIFSLLTMTTTSSHMTHASEMLLSPLQRIGFPVHEIALTNVIALRFVPTLAEELDRIAKAQASRGGTIAERRWWRPDLMVRERMPLLVPLFLNALRRAEELIVAMEARCYLGGKHRSKFVQFKSTPTDWLIVAAAAGLFLIAWWSPLPSRALFPW
jgi:energy-coupling factor transport system permease protein